jgi:hypothetical protein
VWAPGAVSGRLFSLRHFGYPSVYAGSPFFVVVAVATTARPAVAARTTASTAIGVRTPGIFPVPARIDHDGFLKSLRGLAFAPSLPAMTDLTQGIGSP